MRLGRNFYAHDGGGVDDVGPLLEGPVGSAGWDVDDYVGGVGRGGVGREDGLPVFVLGAAKDVLDWVSLGHLGIGPNSPVVGFLNENKVSGRSNG